MSGKEQRQVRPVILTDRVVGAPGISEPREWAQNDTLLTQVRPVGYGGILRPVVVIVNRVEHLRPLITTGIALALMADVDHDDFDVGRCDHRALRAYEARREVQQAQSEMTRWWRDETVEPMVASAMLDRLNVNTVARVPFSKRWEVAVPLFATMVLQKARNLESPMQKAIFGSDSRTPVLVRKDQNRARDFMDLIMRGQELECDDQPLRVDVKAWTKRYLSAVVPALLPGLEMPSTFELDDFSVVTRKGGGVTCHPKQSRHEDTIRPSGTFALNEAFAGFFTCEGSSR